MIGTPLGTLLRHTAFARNYGTPSRLSPRTRVPGLVMDAALGGMSFPDFLSASSTRSAATKSKSSRWLTRNDGRVTGGRDYD